MANAHRIAQAAGIKLHGRSAPHPGVKCLPDRHCWAPKTIKEIAEAGEKAGVSSHIYDVLDLLLANPDGRRLLFSDVLRAVSLWALRADVDATSVAFIKPDFAMLSLRDIRESVKKRGFGHYHITMAFIIAENMETAIQTAIQEMAV